MPVSTNTRHPRPPCPKGLLIHVEQRAQRCGLRGGRIWIMILALSLWAGTSIGPSLVRAQEVTETQVKAVWILNFAKYVDWPTHAFEQDESPITVGVLGQDPIGADLEGLLKKSKAKNRGFVLKTIENEAAMKQCHILFISKSEEKHQPDLLKTLKNQPVLTIGDSGTFTEDGGVIRFHMISNTVRFDINLDAANAAGLRVSSKVVGVAHKVIGKNNMETE